MNNSDSYIDVNKDKTMKVVYSQVDISKENKKIIGLYFDPEIGFYTTEDRPVQWWHGTCQHLPHDEWTRYKVYDNKAYPEEKMFAMISYNEQDVTPDQNLLGLSETDLKARITALLKPGEDINTVLNGITDLPALRNEYVSRFLSRYDPPSPPDAQTPAVGSGDGFHKFDGVKTQVFKKDATPTSDGYTQYEQACTYKVGWWAAAGSDCNAKKVEYVVQKYSPQPSITPSTTPLPTQTPFAGSLPNLSVEFSSYPAGMTEGETADITAKIISLDKDGNPSAVKTDVSFNVTQGNSTVTQTINDMDVNGSAEVTRSFLMSSSPLSISVEVNPSKTKPQEEANFDDNRTEVVTIDSIAKPAASPVPQSTQPSGRIVFTPSSSGWTNKSIPVTMTVNGSTSVTYYGKTARLYWGTYITIENGKQVTHTTKYSADCLYKETWQVASIHADGQPVLTNGVNAPYSSQGANIILDGEGSGALNARVIWQSTGRQWIDPNNINWVDKNAIPPATSSPAETYNSNSGTFNIDRTAPIATSYEFDTSKYAAAKKGSTEFKTINGRNEIYCDKYNVLKISVMDNLSGIKGIYYTWTDNPNRPATASMTWLAESAAQGQPKDIYIPFDTDKSYVSLRKGSSYLHVIAVDEAGNETYNHSQLIFIDKAGNLRISTIYDPAWEKYFRKSDKSETQLAIDGVKVPDFPVYSNNEGANVKLGYGVKMKLDTFGFNGQNDRVRYRVTYYAQGKDYSMHKVKAWIPDKNNVYSSKSEEVIELNSSSRTVIPGVNEHAEWTFMYSLPYYAVFADENENNINDILRNNKYYKSHLLVKIEFWPVKIGGNGKEWFYDYTGKEDRWPTVSSKATVYGHNYNVAVPGTQIPYSNGCIFWYDLLETSYNDISQGRTW